MIDSSWVGTIREIGSFGLLIYIILYALRIGLPKLQREFTDALTKQHNSFSDDLKNQRADFLKHLKNERQN